MPMATVIVGYQVACGGIDKCRQGSLGDHPAGSKEAKEDILNDVFRLIVTAKTAADVGKQLVAVTTVIVD